jgi:L-fuconate dehydratase
LRDRIITVSAFDIRFPTSERLDGSDAMNKDPDYSAAYIVIETASGNQGFGLIFTIGRGNDICCRAVEAMRHLVVGKDFADIKADIGRFYDDLRSDSQIRWLGPEKGVVHMAAGGIVNAVWDLWARDAGKPVWRLLADMSPEEFVSCVDLRYVTDVLTREEAIAIVARNTATRDKRIRYLERHGYPAYTTSAGWLGYDDDKLARLCRESVDQGFRHLKLKVGQKLEDDIRRCRLARNTIGPDVALMIDANQAWEVDQAIAWIRALSTFKPWFIEEPTSPDDVLGHRKIRESIGDIKVATGEHCQNRILFKQFIASEAIDVVQIDACRLAGLNEVLTVCLLAAKYDKPVCPHAGGVGLCEYVQHISMIDYIMISGEIGERVIEYVDHLHEHFVDPCVVVGGAYRAPLAPGFSVRMKQESIGAFEYPHGAEWRARLTRGVKEVPVAGE